MAVIHGRFRTAARQPAPRYDHALAVTISLNARPRIALVAIHACWG